MKPTRPTLRSRAALENLRQARGRDARNGRAHSVPYGVELSGQNVIVSHASSAGSRRASEPQDMMLVELEHIAGLEGFFIGIHDRAAPPLRASPHSHHDLRRLWELHDPTAAGARYARSRDAGSRLRPQPAVNNLDLLCSQQASGVATLSRAPRLPPRYVSAPPPYSLPDDPTLLGEAELARIFNLTPPSSPPPGYEETEPSPAYQLVQPSHVYDHPDFESYSSGLDYEALSNMDVPALLLAPEHFAYTPSNTDESIGDSSVNDDDFAPSLHNRF